MLLSMKGYLQEHQIQKAFPGICLIMDLWNKQENMMKRPYIICHILSALEGKIAGRSFGTPQAQAVSEEYARMPRQYLHGQLFFLKVRRWGFI